MLLLKTKQKKNWKVVIELGFITDLKNAIQENWRREALMIDHSERVLQFSIDTKRVIESLCRLLLLIIKSAYISYNLGMAMAMACKSQ